MICSICKEKVSYLTAKKDDQTVKKVISLFNKGYSSRDISALLNNAVSYTTAQRIIRKYKSKALKDD